MGKLCASERYQVFIDEKEIGSELVSPFEISWNTLNEALGSKTLKAISIDNNNNQKSDEQINNSLDIGI